MNLKEQTLKMGKFEGFSQRAKLSFVHFERLQLFDFEF